MADGARVLVGRYRLASVLGRGGMGQVWLATDEVLGRQVAVKEVRFPADLPHDERDVLRERTLREARLTARLSHRGIITVYDVVSEDGDPFIVMELVRAPSLAAVIDREGSLPPHRVAEVGVRLLDALDVAHAEGVVHRDVKPSNVMLDDERVVLSDFGIATSAADATLTRTGLLVGSPTYMSPERLRSEGVGPAGDLWSLGATLYAALEGRPPFRADTVMGTITAIVADRPPEPSTGDGALADALLGLLQKEPGERLSSAQARPLLERAAVREPRPSVHAAEPVSEAPVMAPAAGADELDGHAADDSGRHWHVTPIARPVPAAARSSVRTRRPGKRSLAAAFVLAVAIGLVVGFLAFTDSDEPSGAPTGEVTPTDEDEPEDADPTSDGPTTPPETDEPAVREVPPGYRLVRDPLDFTVAVPEGWERRLDAATRVDFVSPEEDQFIRIEQRAQALPDAEQAWLDLEPDVASSLSGYERIRIEPVDFRRWEAADWEFTWEGDTGTVHVLNRGFITDPRGFAIYVSGPDDTWEDESLPVFEAVADMFRPSA